MTMDFGIVYHIESPQLFWSELHDVLRIDMNSTSLAGLDLALKTYIDLCVTHHDRFLQTNAQMDHAIDMLLNSELFLFHSERLSDYVLEEAKTTTDPHIQLILYQILLRYARRKRAFSRLLKKWQPLFPLLMDLILVPVEDDSWYFGTNNPLSGIGVPIESRLRTLAVSLLYEVCRVQRVEVGDLRLFTEEFINHLFDLVEQTRDHPDETLNYVLIKLIISINEQFMLSALPPPQPSSAAAPSYPKYPSTLPSVVPKHHHYIPPEPSNFVPNEFLPTPVENKVMNVLLRRMGTSKTFGENLIFMLNRADGSSDDLCMQLLVLKLLYILFTTKGVQEYFYTNDLRVLTDVFIRELVDLPEERESLRHTYLRVLHPLLTNTQLRDHPYKRPQIRNVLLSLVAHGHIRDISPTTKRLVDRCLSAEWCQALEKDEAKVLESARTVMNGNSGAVDTSNVTTQPGPSVVGKLAQSHLGVPSLLVEDDKNAKTRAKPLHKAASMDMRENVAGSSGPSGSGKTKGNQTSPSKTTTRAPPERPPKLKPANLRPTPVIEPPSPSSSSVSPIFTSGASTTGSTASSLSVPVPQTGNDSTASLVTVSAATQPEKAEEMQEKPKPKRRPPPSAPPHSSTVGFKARREAASTGGTSAPSPMKFGAPEKKLVLAHPSPTAIMQESRQGARSNSLSEVAHGSISAAVNTNQDSSSLGSRVLDSQQYRAASTEGGYARSAPSTPPLKHRRKAPAIPAGKKHPATVKTIVRSSSSSSSTSSIPQDVLGSYSPPNVPMQINVGPSSRNGTTLSVG